MTPSSQLVFHRPETFPRLLPGEIHIWCAHLVPQPGIVQYFQTFLRKDERERSASFYHEHDRVRYILAHGYLRSLLGKYVNQNPAHLVFKPGDRGKPFLASRPVEFNMSHAGDLAIFAFSQDGPLGVDIEVRREIPEAADIIQRLFSNREKRIFNKAEADYKPDHFLEYWTRGEAVVKAIGYGFGEKVGAISRNMIIKTGKAWRIKTFCPAPGYVAALAASRILRNITCWEMMDGFILPTSIK